MAATRTLPQIPTDMSSFLEYLADKKDQPVRDLMRPYAHYESQVRTLFAQDPSHPALLEDRLGLVPIYEGKEGRIQIRARDLEIETEDEKAKYIMPLEPGRRKKTGDTAIVDLVQFRKNFRAFTGKILEGIDWNNIVVGGGSVAISMLSISEEENSHFALRHLSNSGFWGGLSTMKDVVNYTQDSDINIYIYGIEPEAAVSRLKTIEKAICEELPIGTICVRTKDFITIVSARRDRHIKISLRIFTSISQVLYSQHFDVDSACVAYDGQQVYSTPQAVASWILQCNIADPLRSYPANFYESRLRKYQKRGFEIYYPNLRRQDIDPSIYKLPKHQHHELQGLAKLLAFEKPSFSKNIYQDVIQKENMEDGVGILGYFLKSIDASGIERQVTNHDEDLNELHGEAQEDRIAYLHRHPAFLGSLEDVLKDCCEHCPQAQTAEERELQAQDDEHYVRGKLILRQEPAPFVSISEEVWTETAYFKGDAMIYQVIADGDTEKIKKWASVTQPGTVRKTLNTRDYTGRMPLHLAVLAFSPEMVELLINLGAKISSLSVDGSTALHAAAARGNTEIVKILLLKSDENEEAKENIVAEQLRAKRHMAGGKRSGTSELEVIPRESATDDVESLDDAIELMSENWDDASASVSVHTGTSSFIQVTKKTEAEHEDIGDMTDFNDILDINMRDNANGMTPLHYAIMNGHEEVVKLLVSEFGADILRPLQRCDKDIRRQMKGGDKQILPPVLVTYIPEKQKREDMLRTLFKLGATSRQLDVSGVTAFVRMIRVADAHCLRIMFEEDGAAALVAAQATIRKDPDEFDDEDNLWQTNVFTETFRNGDEDKILLLLEKGVPPILHRNQNNHPTLSLAEVAINMDMLKVFAKLIEYGIDPSECVQATPVQVLNASPYFSGSESIGDLSLKQLTFLDLIQAKMIAYEHELEYLNMILEYEPGSYEQCVASEVVREHETRLGPGKHRPQELNIAKVARRKSALEGNINCYRECREWLISKGGRTFADLKKRDSIHSMVLGEAKSSKTEKGEMSLRSPPGLLAKNIVKGPDGKPKIHFRYSYAPDDEKIQAAYHDLFKAAWNSDLPTLKKYSLDGWDNDPATSALRFDVKNQNGTPLNDVVCCLGVPMRDQVHKFIYNIQGAQSYPAETEDTEDTENYSNVWSGEPIFRCPRHLLPTLDAIREDDVAALRELLETKGIHIVFNSEINLTGEMELPKRELGYYGMKVRGERKGQWGLLRPSNDKFPIDTQFHRPPAFYAAFWGSRKVYDWLETVGPEEALRRYEQRCVELEGIDMEELKDYLYPAKYNHRGSPDPLTQYDWDLAKGRKEFLLKSIREADGGTIQRWMGVGHPIILHIAVLNRLEKWGPRRTEEEKIAYHRSNFEYLISKTKTNILEYREPHNKMTPLLTAASTHNKCALQALISIGADLYVVNESLVTRRNLIHRMLQFCWTLEFWDDEIQYRFEDCLAILPMEFVDWVVIQNDTPLVCLFKAIDKMTEPAKSHWTKTVLSWSRGAGSNIRNYRGELLIHSATLRSDPEELQNILDMQPPDILFAENMDGRTALEIASELRYEHIQETSDDFFRVSGKWFENLPKHYTWAGSSERLWGFNGIRERNAIKGTGGIRHDEWGTKVGENECIQVWKMLCVAQGKAIQRIGRTRKLVSLSEVNEAINKMSKVSQGVKKREASGENILACWIFDRPNKVIGVDP